MAQNALPEITLQDSLSDLNQQYDRLLNNFRRQEAILRRRHRNLKKTIKSLKRQKVLLKEIGIHLSTLQRMLLDLDANRSRVSYLGSVARKTVEISQLLRARNLEIRKITFIISQAGESAKPVDRHWERAIVNAAIIFAIEGDPSTDPPEDEDPDNTADGDPTTDPPDQEEDN